MGHRDGVEVGGFIILPNSFADGFEPLPHELRNQQDAVIAQAVVEPFAIGNALLDAHFVLAVSDDNPDDRLGCARVFGNGNLHVGARHAKTVGHLADNGVHVEVTISHAPLSCCSCERASIVAFGGAVTRVIAMRGPGTSPAPFFWSQYTSTTSPSIAVMVLMIGISERTPCPRRCRASPFAPTAFGRTPPACPQ